MLPGLGVSLWIAASGRFVFFAAVVIPTTAAWSILNGSSARGTSFSVSSVRAHPLFGGGRQSAPARFFGGRGTRLHGLGQFVKTVAVDALQDDCAFVGARLRSSAPAALERAGALRVHPTPA